MEKSCIQIFAKAPIEGYCKTRLANDIGNVAAAKLQGEMILETIHRLENLLFVNKVQLWCNPDTSHMLFQELAAKYPITLHKQQGNSLGEILDRASFTELKSANTLIQIGTDCPYLGEGYIKTCQENLENCDIVIGPATDGGYTLLAQKEYYPQLYKSVQWGSSTVLAQLLYNIKTIGLDYILLESLSDIDTIEDLNKYKFFAK